MKNIKLLYLASLLLTILASCETDIDYNGERIEPILVINSQLVVGENVSCHISNSKPITESSGLENIDEAQVQLFANGMLIDEMTNTSEGNYISNSIVEENTKYEIRAVKNGYASVSAKCNTPQAPEATIQKIKAIGYVFSNSLYSFEGLRFTIKINDPKEENYYRIKVFALQRIRIEKNNESSPGEIKHERTYDTIFWNETAFESKDPLISIDYDDFSNEPENYYRVFTDETFNGESYLLNLTTRFRYGSTEKWHRDSIRLTYKVQLQEITKGMFLYYKSHVAQNWYEEDPFAEPVQLYSNVENGAGIVGAIASKDLFMKTEYIELGEPEIK